MLALTGLDPSVKREYTWIGDSAVDMEASDLQTFIDTGLGLVFKDGESQTVFTCQPLTPTRLSIVYSKASLGLPQQDGTEDLDANQLLNAAMPAVYRAAVAYGVVKISGIQMKTVYDSGGKRLSDALLDQLDSVSLRIEKDGQSFTLRLLTHLGALILSDSIASPTEKKVL